MIERPSAEYVARAILELRTPLSIGTGQSDDVFDTALVRDANGLPAIPATSLAGVLRSLYAAEHGAERADAVFGWQSGSDGAASGVSVGWGAMLDSAGRAAWGLLLGKSAERLRDDPLFAQIVEQRRTPTYRNRVRLTHKGAAAMTGKFDRSVVPAGHRFAVELRLRAHPEDGDSTWSELLALMAHPGLRLGAATRAGLGAVRCASLYAGRFDLRDPVQVAALGALGADPSVMDGLQRVEPAEPSSSRWTRITVELRPEGLWRVGQDGVPVGVDGKEPDLVPMREPRVTWTAQGTATIERQPRLLLPGSSLKGVLAHRMAFHARRFERTWTPNAEDRDTMPACVRALLGEIKNNAAATGKASGMAGALFIDDAWVDVEPTTTVLTHNAIDRFTGGVREHMLFDEQVVYRGVLRVNIALDVARLQTNCAGLAQDVRIVRRAFDAALDDLCRGLLAIGARSTTGLGFCCGTVEPSRDALWEPLSDPAQPRAA